jgi:simple sugar transport system permease protein
MILSGLLMVFMSRGGSEISTTFGLNNSFGDILTGVILFFVIGSEFFINYQLHFRKSHRKEAADV